MTMLRSGLLAARPGFARHFGRAFADSRGVAAVEFALILPVMLALYIGSVEVSQLLSADRKVVLLTRTLADLVTQSDTADNTSLTQVFNAGAAVLSPLSSGNAQMRVTSIAISTDTSREATACWSYSSSNYVTIPKGQILTTSEVPTSLREPGTSLVLAEVRYTYTPAVGYIITGQLTLQERIFMRPRISTYVSNPNFPNSGKPTAASGPC